MSSNLTSKSRAEILRLVEWYLSDENLKRDSFFNHLISFAEDGFIPCEIILECPKMKKLRVTQELLIEVVGVSEKLELRKRADTNELRRKHALCSREASALENLEPTLEELPLQLLRNGVQWEAVIEDLPRRSFCHVMRSRFSEECLKQEFEVLRNNIPWTRLENRTTAWLLLDLSGQCTCSYTYGRTTVLGTPVTPPVLSVCSRYFRELGLCKEEWPDAANVNLYIDGADSIGWHRDDEKMFDGVAQDCRIASLSLGATRSFQIALADELSKRDDQPIPLLQTVTAVDLHSGDICAMEGLFQKHYLHSVPKLLDPSRNVGPRINLTFRWIRHHRSTCTLR